MSARRVAGVVGFALLLWLSIAAWALASPVGAAPDDDYHLANIYCAAGEATCTPEGKRLFPCYAWSAQVTGDCTPAGVPLPQGDRGLLATAPLGAEPAPSTTGINVGWYPPLYYETASLLVQDTTAGTTLAVRLANTTLTVVLALVSVLLSRPAYRRAVAFGWLAASVPMGMFVAGSTNASAWAVAGIAAMWGPLLSVLTDNRFDRLTVGRLVFVQVAAIIALGSRSEPPIYIGILCVSLTLAVLRAPRQMTRQAWALLAAPAVLCLEALLAMAVFLPSKTALQPDDPTSWTDDPFTILVTALSTPLEAVAGARLGWLDTPMPPIVNALAAGAFLGTVLLGLAVLGHRKAVALGSFVGFSLLFLVYLYATADSTPGYQPRYFLPLLCVAAGLALLPRTADEALAGKSTGPVPPGGPRAGGDYPLAGVEAGSRAGASDGRSRRGRGLPTGVQAAVLLGMLVLANSAALNSNLNRYVFGGEGGLAPLSALSAARPGWWWPNSALGPGGIWVLGSLAFAAACALVWWLLRPRPAGSAESWVASTV